MTEGHHSAVSASLQAMVPLVLLAVAVVAVATGVAFALYVNGYFKHAFRARPGESLRAPPDGAVVRSRSSSTRFRPVTCARLRWTSLRDLCSTESRTACLVVAHGRRRRTARVSRVLFFWLVMCCDTRKRVFCDCEA